MPGVSTSSTDVVATVPEAFVTAMDDDLGTPAAVGAIHDVVRAGNTALGEGDLELAATHAAEVRAMLAVLGLDPAHAHWSTDSSNDLTGVVDALVKGLLDQRAEARAAKDFATADAIRDRIKAAGVTIEDTPTGPKWSVGGCQVIRSAEAPSRRPGRATPRPGPGDASVVASRARAPPPRRRTGRTTRPTRR